MLLVIPAYRESQRLPGFLLELAEALKTSMPESDILIIDDGSGKIEQDILINLISSLQGEYPFILNPICLKSNLGKGGAILTGWDQAKGYDYLGFVDADGAVSPSEVVRVAANTSEAYQQGQSIFGSRIRMLGRKISRGWSRHISGRIFSFIVGVMIEPEIYDSQCGLKFIPQPVYTAIRSRINGRRFAFDVELVAALRSGSHPVVEVPIDWHDVAGSKVSLLKDTISMTLAVVQIRREMKKWT